MRGEADVTHMYLFEPFILRIGLFEYLHPIRTQWHYIIFKQPPIVLHRSIYLDPFTPSLWMAWLGASVLITIMLYLARDLALEVLEAEIGRASCRERV